MTRFCLCACLVALAISAEAQPASGIPISGRIVDANHVPLPDRTVTFAGASSPLPYVNVKTDANGVFTFVAANGVAYWVSLDPSALFLTIDVVRGQSVALGDVVSLQDAAHLSGPVHIGSLQPGPPSIAALYVTYPEVVPDKRFDYGVLHLILRNGKDLQPLPEKDQVGVSHPAISAGGSAAGWLVDCENCCTSYPLSLQLTIYAPGMPLRRFRGDGRAIFAWHFLAAGKQVAFQQSYPHGELRAHDEMRSVVTGRFIAKWDEDDDAPRPAWTDGLN
jgi:hypothetical protein